MSGQQLIKNVWIDNKSAGLRNVRIDQKSSAHRGCRDGTQNNSLSKLSGWNKRQQVTGKIVIHIKSAADRKYQE
jgi:hypothetical protein